MKSAYERALERFGDDDSRRELSAAQKQQLAEIEQDYKARIAQEELRRDRAQGADAEQLREQANAEIARLRANCERDKDRVRRGEA